MKNKWVCAKRMAQGGLLRVICCGY